MIASCIEKIKCIQDPVKLLEDLHSLENWLPSRSVMDIYPLLSQLKSINLVYIILMITFLNVLNPMFFLEFNSIMTIVLISCFSHISLCQHCKEKRWKFDFLTRNLMDCASRPRNIFYFHLGGQTSNNPHPSPLSWNGA